MKVLIFDVETTGLLPKVINTEEISKYPNIIQLSFILYDTSKKEIEESFNEYIILNRKTKIPKIVTDLTGIDKEKSLSGVSIMTGLERFNEAYKRANKVVSHNFEFDSKMIYVEVLRNKSIIKEMKESLLNLLNIRSIELDKEKYCTMKRGRYVCKIKAISKDGNEYLKWPKLIELYKELFKEGIENLHDSLVDTVACLRCYLKMTQNYDIGKEETIKLIEKL